MARAVLEAFRGIGAILQQVGQRRVVVPLLDDIDAREGQIIVGVADGQIIRLPPGNEGDPGQIGIVLTDVISPVTIVNPDGTTQELGTPGVYDFTNGAPDVYSTSPGGTILAGARPALSVLGRAASTAGAVSDIAATGRRQVLSTGALGALLSFQTLSSIFPGAPIYDVMAHPFNATGSLASDDTAAINAAIVAANAAPGIIYLGPAHRITAGLTPITNNNIRLLGRGEFNGGTILQVDSAAAVDAITVSGCQYVGIERIWITGTKVFTSGFGIRFVGTFRCYTDRVVISTMCFGIEHVNCTLSEVRRTNLGDLYGIYGFLARGTGGNFNHAVRYECCVGGTNYPATVVGAGTVWAASTAYVVGNIVFANNNIYQCVQAGTSGASAPSGSGTTATNAHTTQITDGTAKWVFAMPLNNWFFQESGSQTFEVIDCGTLQGGYGLRVGDSTGSNPLFCRVQNFQVDHPFSAGIQLDAGAAIRMNQVLVTSVQEGSGIVIGSGVSGNWEIIGGEVFGCNKAGVTIARGDGLLDGVQIGACGGISANTRDCIEVTNSASRFRIVGCSGGSMIGATSPSTRYGISIAAGSDNYAVVGNVFAGNLTAGILNTPGTSTTRVVRNNVPDSGAVPDADYGDITVTGTGSVWTIDNDVVTFAKMQNIGYGVLGFPTFGGSGDPRLIAPPGSFTVLQDDGSGTLAFRLLNSTSIAHGALGVYERAALTGDVTAAQNSNTTAIAAGVIVDADVNASAGIAQTKTGALSGFADKASGSAATTSAEPIVTYSASANMSAERVTTSSTSVAVSTATANQIEFQRAALTGSVTAALNVNATQFASMAANTSLLPTRQFYNWIGGTNTTVTGTSNATDILMSVNVDDFPLSGMADLAQSRIIGRAEGAGTGIPQALTPTQVVAIIDAENATWTGAHSFTGSSHTVDTAGSITLEGDSDCSLASVTGGLALGAGHVVVSPSVDNGDVVVNAKGGVGINAHATTPVTGAATGNIELTAAGDVVVTAADQLDVTAENGIFVHFSPVAADGGTVRFQTGSALSTPPSGQVALTGVTSSTVPRLEYKTSTISERVGFTANSNSVQTANGTQTNSTTNITVTSVAPNANAWAVGTVYRLEGFFVFAHTAAATPTITLELLIQGSVVESLVITPVAVATTYAARAVATIVCRTTGASGTAMCTLHCINDFGDVTSQSNAFSKATTADALDTTSAASLLLRVRMTTAVASNTLTVVEGFSTRLA